MKVLQVSNYFYPHIGGIEQVARDVCNSIGDMKNVQQEVICFNSKREDESSVIDGVKITYVGTFVKIASQSLSTHYGRALKNRIKEFNPDVIIFHYPNPFVAAFLLKILKKKKNIKLVLYWHLDIFKQKFLKIFFKGQNIKLLKRAERIVSTSPDYIRGSEYLSMFASKCISIPNCVRTDINISEEVKEKVNEIKSKNKDKTVCFAVGRHIPYKGMDHLIRASRYLNETFKIYIGGSGPLTDELKKLASGDEKIEFLGRISKNDLTAYYNACDIFCFPSITKNEAFGIALAEAMSYGKPAVTFTIKGSGVNFVSVNGKTGIEVKNGDCEAYAKAINKLARNNLLREEMGKEAYKRVKENFTFEIFRKNIKNLLESL